MTKLRHFLVLALPLMFTGIVLAQDAPRKKLVRILIIGDATVCNHPPGSIQHGWGEMIGIGFEDNVRIRNIAGLAVSTKSILTDDVFRKAFDEKFDFVLIQLGHYDSLGPTYPASTEPFGSYKANLREIVDACKTAGTQPILITPMHRRRFYRDRLSEELKPYAYAMRAVGREKKVPVVDLYSSSGDLMERIGEIGSADLFSKEGDADTFSEKGARIMAALVLEGLRKVSPKLAAVIPAETESNGKAAPDSGKAAPEKTERPTAPSR